MAKAAVTFTKKKPRKEKGIPRLVSFRHAKCGGITLVEKSKEVLIGPNTFCQWCRAWFPRSAFERTER